MEVRKVSGGIIINDGKILLIKRRHEPNKNTWCPPGGFTEKSINEPVEDCCIREVKEETNIDVEIIKKLDILKFYNKIKDRDEEVHIFLCKPKSTEIIVDDEVLDAKWISLNEIDNLNLIPGFSDFVLKHKEDFI
ncbi:MAG: NUDIX domain-containing protein [Candidatus Pacearchaeota archaeon]|nr:NUDIX domain-containing protein [Candidatus Pacearchaeota archaeon]